MPISTFTIVGDIERKYMAVAINVAEPGQPEELVVIGYKITSSQMETNPDIESGTDIRGVNFSSVNKLEPTQTFEPHRLTGGVNGKLGERLLDMFRYRKMSDFSNFTCVHIWGMLEVATTPGTYEADKFDACSISINGIGGESWTDMPFQVTYGGIIVHGTANGLIDVVQFTPNP